MKTLKQLLLLLTDRELFKKPRSTNIREQTVKDILSVDGKKWFHPKLPNGQTSPHWGTIEIIDGKEISKPGDVDLFIYEHPDLNYRISDCPLGSCKEGEFENVTEKDCEIIGSVLYASRDKTVSFINLTLTNKLWYILYYKSKNACLFFIFLLVLCLLLYFFTKVTIVAIGFLCFVGLLGYAFEQVIKNIKKIWTES